MESEDIVEILKQEGYGQQENYPYCDFMIVINNCKDTTYYFKYPENVKNKLRGKTK